MQGLISPQKEEMHKNSKRSVEFSWIKDMRDHREWYLALLIINTHSQIHWKEESLKREIAKTTKAKDLKTICKTKAESRIMFQSLLCTPHWDPKVKLGSVLVKSRMLIIRRKWVRLYFSRKRNKLALQIRRISSLHKVLQKLLILHLCQWRREEEEMIFQSINHNFKATFKTRVDTKVYQLFQKLNNLAIRAHNLA